MGRIYQWALHIFNIDQIVTDLGGHTGPGGGPSPWPAPAPPSPTWGASSWSRWSPRRPAHCPAHWWDHPGHITSRWSLASVLSHVSHSLCLSSTHILITWLLLLVSPGHYTALLAAGSSLLHVRLTRPGHWPHNTPASRPGASVWLYPMSRTLWLVQPATLRPGLTNGGARHSGCCHLCIDPRVLGSRGWLWCSWCSCSRCIDSQDAMLLGINLTSLWQHPSSPWGQPRPRPPGWSWSSPPPPSAAEDAAQYTAQYTVQYTVQAG